MFKEEREQSLFRWEHLGDITTGRPHLGDQVPVVVYRLLQYTMRDVLITSHGVAQAGQLFVQAGELAGEQFCLNVLHPDQEFGAFVAELQQTLKDLKIGILRIEKADVESLEFVLTVAEDLDCSGLPITDETVCDYDEGFIAGILKAYTGRPFRAREIDCWANGDRVCRFEAQAVTTEQVCSQKTTTSCTP